MIFIIDNSGGILKSVPSPVYQGSNLASEIILAGYIPSWLTVTVSFTLPNGVISEEKMMTAGGAFTAEDGTETKVPIYYWTYRVPFSVTEFAGKVIAQFRCRDGNGQITASGAAGFSVTAGSPILAPEKPESTTVEEIFKAIASIALDADAASGNALAAADNAEEAVATANEAKTIAEEADENADTALANANEAKTFAEATKTEVENSLAGMETAIQNISATAGTANTNASNALSAVQTANAEIDAIQTQVFYPDEKPALGSTKLAQSGGIYAAIAEALEKAKAHTNSAVDALTGGGIRFEIVESVDLVVSENIIYLVPVSVGGDSVYDEYLFINGEREKIGSTAIDLSAYSTTVQMNAAINTAISTALASYYTKTETDNLLASYLRKTEAEGLYVKLQTGYGLSQEDFTTEEKTKLAGLTALPTVSTADAGAFLRVNASGVWAAEQIAYAEEVEF